MAITTPIIAKTRAVQKRSSPNANGNATKAKGKASGNGNIMSFFKKAESMGTSASSFQADEDSLFLEEGPVKGQCQVPMQTPTPPRDEGLLEDVEMMRNESPVSRYNEDAVSVKRRKVEEPEVQSPIPPTKATPEPSKRGPFIDDSDEDDEDPIPPEIAYVPPKNQPDDASTIVSVPTRVEVNLDKSEIEHEPPLLNREAASFSRENDFEGMDDFIDDEFPEDGEEYMERRWMEEQGMGLEDDDDSAEATITPKEETSGSPSLIPKDAGSQSCPICGGNTTGMDEQVSPTC